MQDQPIATMLWRGKWIIITTLAIGIGLAVFITFNEAKVYQATAVIQVSSVTNPAANAVDVFGAQEASQGLAQTYATLFTDRSFLEQVRPQVASGRLSASDLKGRLSAKAIDKTNLIELKATAPSPTAARDLAGQLASAFVANVRDNAQARSGQQQSAIQNRITALNTQIRDLAAQPQTSTVLEQIDSLKGARTALKEQLAQVVANGVGQAGSVALAAPPTASSSPIRPRPVLNYLAGGLLGLLLGFSLSWVRMRLDRGLHSSSEAEELLGAPVLATVPMRKGLSAGDRVVGEAFDVLRANLAFLSLDHSLGALTVSSYHPREGKTTTVEGLARAAVRGGLSVLLVDGDVRTRTLSAQLGHADAPGLTNVVAGLMRSEDAVVAIEPGLSLLPAGPTPPNPPSLLSSGRMRELMGHLRAQHSLIVIDSPPVAHLADASILASISDGVVVVARVGLTARADLPAAAAKLRHSPTPIVGVVVLEPRGGDEAYYPAMAERRAPVPGTVRP